MRIHFMRTGLASRLLKTGCLSFPAIVVLSSAAEAHAQSLSNADMARVELGFSYIRGDANLGVATRVPFGGAVGGIRYAGAQFLRKWVGYEVDFRLAFGGINGPQADVGLDLAAIFAPARWRGRYPGSFVLGTGLGAGLGRPMWLGLGQSVYAFALARFMILPNSRSRVQVEYRISPISTHPLSFGNWVMAHDVDIAAGKELYQFGLRGRMESVAPIPSFIPASSGIYRSWWIGPFLGIVVK